MQDWIPSNTYDFNSGFQSMSERRKRESSAPPILSTPTKPRVTTLTPIPIPGRVQPKHVYVTHYEEDFFNPSGRKGLPPPQYSTTNPNKDDSSRSRSRSRGRGTTPGPESRSSRGQTPGPPSPTMKAEYDSVYDDYESKQLPFQSSPPLLPSYYSAVTSQPYKSSPVLSATGQLIRGILKTPEHDSPGGAAGMNNKKKKKRVTIDPILDFNSPVNSPDSSP
ncbi:hypothetical protein QBC44DRAFT_60167 [Cladorrhinum sp. PSN332]|nr:hypothetical protein QBC44DRAFT_60167 [Cladorrhinum sp. PSN332]